VAQLVEALRKVAGSIPDGVIGIFLGHILPAALGSTQPLTELSTRNISWRGGGGGVKTVGA
jgi:hypothetical protein